MTNSWSTPGRRADMFLPAGDDPRAGAAPPDGERAVLAAFLRGQRATLELKCSGLDAAALARRSAEPSTMSLLGLVRHLADVERGWMRARVAGQNVAPRFRSAADPDGDFDGAVADPEVVAGAWRAWREETAFTDRLLSSASGLDAEVRYVGHDGGAVRVSLREVVVHLIEEYARHNGHADLLRERVDGRVGE
ncbi:DinB family protein [Streptomyces sp. HNM0574]|uniref:DinB family protein n=1 Tax=Streptomyces sp. HNM0574 TaxID=2714954 RepID=UPI0019D22956|nr:DinB family protein [Streptomyces sp. HNM0574]